MLASRGDEVTATGRSDRPVWLPAAAEWLAIDLLDPDQVATCANDYWGAIHLASETVPSRFSSPLPLLDNLAMLLNLTEHLKTGRLVYVSSCHVYAPGRSPCRESDVVRPQGRYGLSKHLCEQAALAAHPDVRVARPFNHIGQGMQTELAVPSMVRRVRAGGDGPMIMHGLDSVRDFLDVEDIARAYLALLDLDQPGERVFNICSGAPVTIGELARVMLGTVGDDRTVEFQQRATSGDDTHYLVGDPTRISAMTGWKPQLTLAASVQRMFSGS